MMTLMRTIVDLTEEQLEGLTNYCQRLRISRAEAVRQAVEKMLKEKTKPDGKLPGFGIWKDRKIDALNYVRKLREEWDRPWDKK